MKFRLMASRHSAFYSPLLSTVSFLQQDGHQVTYGVLAPGQRTHELLRDGAVDVIQSAVSSNWKPIESGIAPLPVHFAQINRRDGFFLVARDAAQPFAWKHLEGRSLLADHGGQPLAMLQYAARHNGVDWSKIGVIDAGAPAAMEAAFRDGRADYVHLQAPFTVREVVASVGASMPPVAFSSLCCSRDYQRTEDYAAFVETFARAKEWVRTAPPGDIAAAEDPFFDPALRPALADAIERYQSLGCWDGGIRIPPDLYEQSLNVFESAGAIARRHPYAEVVG